MEGLKNLNVDPEFVEEIKKRLKNFGVEADIKCGDMLAHDEEEMDMIMGDRLKAFDMLGAKGDMDIDKMLAFEKLYVEGERVNYLIERVDTMIHWFSLVKDSEAYKAKIEGLDCLIDDEGLPIDSGRAAIASHLTSLENPLFVCGVLEGRLVSNRSDLVRDLEFKYKSLQHNALNPEKEATKTKEAGTELSP